MPDTTTFDTFIRARAAALRSGDLPPASLKEWQERRGRLRENLFAAMGPMPEKPIDLSPRIIGKLQRKGYRIENILLQSRPDVWISANAYVPETASGKVPAVLVVHGHWAGARRDPDRAGCAAWGWFSSGSSSWPWTPSAPANGIRGSPWAAITARFWALRCGRPGRPCWACKSTTTAGPSITC